MVTQKAVVQDFEMKLEECLNVTDNANREDGEEQERVERKTKPATVKRPGRTKPGRKLPTRRARKESSSESSSEAEVENHPPTRQKGKRAERRIIESDSEEEPVLQKRPIASRRTKVIQEATTSGKKRLSENNSF